MSKHSASNGAVSQRASVGKPVELARYSVHGCERIVYGKWIDDLVHVIDAPTGGRGRFYPVDCCRAHDGRAAVEALVADYICQAKRGGEIPMVAGIVERVEQVALARYEFTGGERVLYGQRVNGVVRVTDRPARGPERSYLVECDVEPDGFPALEALIVDYTCQAARRDDIPMAMSSGSRSVER
jgi:hypothetical protein